MIVPFFKNAMPDIGLLYIPFAVIVVVGASNAVNLTDGLDGLAIGSTIVSAAAFTVLTYVSGHRVFSDYLDLLYLPRVVELTVFCGAMVGASMGFLWWNCYPARIFMGDVGSLSLGGALGTVAILIKQELLLVAIGGLFVIEALSVMLQVVSFKTPRQAHLPHVPPAPPFRAHRLEGDAGRGPVLDRGLHLRLAVAHHVEAAMTEQGAVIKTPWIWRGSPSWSWVWRGRGSRRRGSSRGAGARSWPPTGSRKPSYRKRH